MSSSKSPETGNANDIEMWFDIVLTNTFMKCIIANLYLNACKWSFSSVLSHIQFQFKEELDENGNFTEHLIPNSFN